MGTRKASDDSDDDVIIKRTRRRKTEKDVNSKSAKQKNDSSDDDVELKLSKQIRIIAILLFAVGVILLLAMISYTPRDEIFTEISFVEFFKLMAGNDIIKAKYEGIQNWLGIIGTLSSDFFYNYLFGYITILIPFYMFLWSKDLFVHLTISKDLARRTILFIIFGFLFASFMGVLQQIDAFSNIAREWSGTIGIFISMIFIGVVGKLGAILIILAVAAVTFIFGTNVNINKLLHSFSLGKTAPFRALIRLKNWVSLKLNMEVRPFEDDEETANHIKEYPDDDIRINRKFEPILDDVEPAHIIKRSINIQKNINQFEDIDVQDDNTTIIPDNFDNGFELNGKIEETKIPDDDVISKIIPESNYTEDEIDNVEYQPEVQTQDNPSTKKPLTVTVNEKIEEIEEAPINLLGTDIHDEEIQYLSPGYELLNQKDELADINDSELEENARLLREKLETFKIEIDNLTVTPGPVVTQYEFVPAPGIKVSRIESLADDIAMALKARGIRIIAPIPGKGTVGIEIPNRNPSIVRFSSIVKSARFHQSEHRLPIALGKTIGGDVYCADLSKMPHLLIAGSTGSGKSVGINTVLASLIYKKHPSELKFVIIDPKKVELNLYSSLQYHFLATSPDINDLIITSPEDAVIILKSLCAEMDRRYDILAQVGQRNILDYNAKVKSGKYKDDKEFVHRAMPYIVVIIDELADLMMTAAKEVEAPIIRLAQLARAVGIHLVVATQRPSVDVITGIIKANFPARIAYLVASKIDSRTILDQSGAEQLLGNGDLLFLPGGSPKPIRIQNSFISTDEVEALCEHIGNQKGYSKPYLLPSLIENGGGAGSISKDDRDPLFAEAARLVISLQQASVSIVQRRLKVGYARAGKIIDELEDAGVVGPYAGSKAREVILESESELEAIL
jgi:S-DNA-T family DNA segregation ATPase FtsK/SpoIIIE